MKTIACKMGDITAHLGTPDGKINLETHEGFTIGSGFAMYTEIYWHRTGNCAVYRRDENGHLKSGRFVRKEDDIIIYFKKDVMADDNKTDEQKFAEQYPELVKMNAVQKESQAIGAFLDDLMNNKGIALTTYNEGGIEYFDKEFEKEIDNAKSEVERHTLRLNNPSKFQYISEGWRPVHKPIEKLLAEYFGIDLNKVEKEKQELLQSVREQNTRREAGKEN